MNVLMNTPINGVNVKPREFFICDETDNSGYSVMEWSEKEAKRQFGSCNVFHVIEYSEIDRLKSEVAAYREVVEFYADKDGEHWAACQPQDTKDTCCHMVCENSGGEKARDVLLRWKK